MVDTKAFWSASCRKVVKNYFGNRTQESYELTRNYQHKEGRGTTRVTKEPEITRDCFRLFKIKNKIDKVACKG